MIDKNLVFLGIKGNKLLMKIDANSEEEAKRLYKLIERLLVEVLEGEEL